MRNEVSKGCNEVEMERKGMEGKKSAESVTGIEREDRRVA